MKKILILDLYDTVLKDISFDFNQGTKHLHNKYFSDKCTFNEIKTFQEKFLPLYDLRSVNHTEVCLAKDEMPLVFEEFNVPLPEDMELLDFEVMQQMQQVTLLEEVKETLKYLHDEGVSMYILSNSIFMESSAWKLLESFGINQCFKKLYSSADYGIRKPSQKFFNLAIAEILSDNPAVNRNDIFYVGNDYKTDVMGATEAGLKTIWYNVKHCPNVNNVEVWDIDDFRELKGIVEITD